MPLKCT